MSSTVLNTQIASFIGAELGIVVSLVVFVLLTAILLTFIILLFAWKRFRNLFFGSKRKSKPKKQTEQNKQPAPAAKGGKAQAERSSKKAANYYDDGVPTVPLDIPDDFGSERKNTKRDITLDDIHTVVIKTPKAEDQAAARKGSRASSGGAKPATKGRAKPAKSSNTSKKNGKQ